MPIPWPASTRLLHLTPERLDPLLALETQAHITPWSREHFDDALAAGYCIQLLVAEPETLLGYYVLMPGVNETHLLNIAVAPEHQGHGWGHLLLEAATLWTRTLNAQYLWLEVRASNARARCLYEKHGFQRVGERKRYYAPDPQGVREDAIVMSLQLWP